MKLSIVATLYRSMPTIDEFHRRISLAARAITEDYEIVLVNDGSPDDSLASARALVAKDEHVVVVDLSRNFGHHKAMMTGLAHARGDFVFLIDSDLEEPPELLPQFWETLHGDADADVVYGVQRSRKGGLMERISGGLYYDIFNALSPVKVAKNMSVVRLMTRRYVDHLLQHREHELVFIGLAALTGYKQLPQSFDKASKGSSSYNLVRKLDLVANSIAAFSTRPLIAIFYLGLLLTLASMVLAGYFAANYMLHGDTPSGWTSLIISVWVICGLILLSLGVIGIYLAKMFSEVKDRPYTIVRAVHGRDA